MFTIQYYCPKEAPIWQQLTEGWIFKTPRRFADFGSAQDACNDLMWKYHSARVINPNGQVVYQL